VEVQYESRSSGSVTFARLAVECHLFALFKGFLNWVREEALAGEGGGGIGGNYSQVC